MKKVIVLFGCLLLCLSFLGCSKEDAKPTKDVKPTAKIKTETEIYYDKFVNLKMGSTYEQVKMVLGEGTRDEKNSVPNVRNSYKWKNGTIDIICIFMQDKLSIKTSPSFFKVLPASEPVSKLQLSQLKDGFTYEQAIAVLKQEPCLLTEIQLGNDSAKTYIFRDTNSDLLYLTFKDGKLASKVEPKVKL